jgi:hypothetical protein
MDGALWVFLFQEPIAGLSLGDAHGPRLGLLGGGFAPLIAMPRSDRAYQIRVASSADRLNVAFTDHDETLELELRAPRQGRLSVRLTGAPYLLVPADRTEIRGSFEGRPSFARTITSGENEAISAPRAERVEIKTTKLGALTIDSACPRPIIVEPTLRGATSVFLLRFGPPPSTTDPLFGVEHSALMTSSCPTSVTSTLTVSWPANP